MKLLAFLGCCAVVVLLPIVLAMPPSNTASAGEDKSGWGSSSGWSQPTNGSEYVVGSIAAVQNLSAIAGAVNNISMSLAGANSTPIALSSTSDQSPELYTNPYTDGVELYTPEGEVVYTGQSNLLVDQNPEGHDAVSVVGADAILYTGNPYTIAGTSADQAVLSTWGTFSNGTGFVNNGAGWGSPGWKKPEVEVKE